MLGKKNLFRTQAVILVMVLVMSALLNLSGCGNKAQEADADLTETTTAPADETTDTETSETEEDETETETEEVEGTTEAETEEGTEEEEPEGTTADETTGSETESGTEQATTTTQAATETSEEPTAAATSGYTYTSMSKTMYVKQQVNVRSTPSKDGSKLGTLSAGTEVTVTGQCNETSWYRIEYNGGTGYVSNNYLTTTKPSTTTTTTAGSTTESTTTTKKSTETTTKTYSSVMEKYLDLGNCASFTDSEIEELCELMAEEVVELVNEKRTAAGLWTLTTNTKLTKAAQIRAEELATLFEHTRPNGTDCCSVILEVGLSYITGAENIAMGQTSATEVMSDWMASAGHKGNILTGNYGDTNTKVSSLDGKTYEHKITNIGVGCYYDKSSGTFYWVQLFAQIHTHTWDDELLECFYFDSNGNIVSDYEYSCTDPFCSAYKDENGVIHEHEND